MKLKLTKSNISKIVERGATSIVVAQLIERHKIVQAEFSKFQLECDDYEQIEKRFESVSWLLTLIEKLTNSNSKKDYDLIHEFSNEEKSISMLITLGFSVKDSSIISLYLYVFHSANTVADANFKIIKIGRDFELISTCMLCKFSRYLGDRENATLLFKGCELENVEDSPHFGNCFDFEERIIHDE
jgi:hypothetical protein